jgi:archaellum biogenesis ATPase FlaH
MYNFNEMGHTIVLGQTQTGKTYATEHILKTQKQGVIFFNTQLETLRGYIQINKFTSFKIIKNLLNKGQKLNYTPVPKLQIQEQEIKFLVNQLFEFGNFSKEKNIFIAIDEVHLFTKTSQQAIERIATSGLKFGLNGIFLSQRPANMSNTLMSQSIEMLIFKCSMESQYFKNYNIPIENILEKIEKNGKYSFCTYDFTDVKEYNKI